MSALKQDTLASLAAAADRLRTLAAIEEDVLAADRGAVEAVQLATRIVNHLQGADPGATRDLADTLDTILEGSSAPRPAGMGVHPDALPHGPAGLAASAGPTPRRDPFFVPRVLALVSAAALLSAPFAPLYAHPWQDGGSYLVAGLVFAYVAHGMAARVRARRRAVRALRRLGRLAVEARNVRVVPPPHVADDPAVSLLAHVRATPGPVVWMRDDWSRNKTSPPSLVEPGGAA